MEYELEFEWDPAKDVANQAKHGVSFDEARAVFLDENAIVMDDPDHSDVEDRFVLVGSSSFRTLVVCHCYRNDVIRIISARKANRIDGDLSRRAETMRDSYDFRKGRPNPYARRLKQSVTIRIDPATLEYFKQLADELTIPYQTLINMYLRDCAVRRKQPRFEWKARPQKSGK